MRSNPSSSDPLKQPERARLIELAAARGFPRALVLRRLDGKLRPDRLGPGIVPWYLFAERASPADVLAAQQSLCQDNKLPGREDSTAAPEGPRDRAGTEAPQGSGAPREGRCPVVTYQSIEF